MFSKSFIRVLCIIMAVLMALSACAVLVSVLAVDEGYYETYVNPSTGDNDGDYLIPAGIAVAALLAIIICVVLPKIKKKNADGDDEEDDEEDDNEEGEEPYEKITEDESKAKAEKGGRPEIIRSDNKKK